MVVLYPPHGGRNGGLAIFHYVTTDGSGWLAVLHKTVKTEPSSHSDVR